jgi:pyrimidine-specific ribonucleoside hydrolase
LDVLIDTDPGMGTLGSDPEDSLAITLALACPELTVRAITCVHGNVPVRHSYANAAHLLHVLRRSDVPLAAGAEGPLLSRRRGPSRWLAERDGLDGLFRPRRNRTTSRARSSSSSGRRARRTAWRSSRSAP